MSDLFSSALLELIKTSNDFSTGNAETHDLFETSNRFLKLLEQLIDRKIDSNIEERKKFKQQRQSGTTELNIPPAPLNILDIDNIDLVRDWFIKYTAWYASVRNGTYK